MRFRGDMEPPSLFSDFVRAELLKCDKLNSWTMLSIAAERPDQTFLSVQDDGRLLGLNYTPRPATVEVNDAIRFTIPSYGIGSVALP